METALLFLVSLALCFIGSLLSSCLLVLGLRYSIGWRADKRREIQAQYGWWAAFRWWIAN